MSTRSANGSIHPTSTTSPPYRRRCGNAGQQPESYFRAPQDTPATLTLRAAMRARKDLVAHRVAACNQLRAHLAVAFPAAIGLFFDLDSPISLAFLTRFGSQDAAAPLDEQALAGWLKTIPVRGRLASAGVLCDRGRRSRPGRHHRRPDRNGHHARRPGQDPGDRNRHPSGRPP
jgi:hypothetical protein